MRRRREREQSGIALFMVMAALAVLTVLVGELTYSTQMNSRLAYNYVDNIKAFYLAKAGLKLSLVRLKAYAQIANFVNDPNNKQVKDVLGKNIMEKIWSMPFIYPIPIPKDASMAEGDAVKNFLKESKLSGSFTANISGESEKLNLNNLFIKEAVPQAQGPSGASGGNPPPPPPPGGPNPTPSPTPTPVDFRKVLEPAIVNAIELRKNDDREFADVYRNVQGKDIVDAIMQYLFKDAPPSNLPGSRDMKPKLAPFYSLSELHLIPGIDDEIFKILEPMLTVYTTPGINVNKINKPTLRNLIPEITDPEADDLLRKRDDPDVGQPFGTADDFWNAVNGTSAGKNLADVKKRFTDANLNIITDELSFKVSVLANVGQSTRRLEAFVIVDPKAAKQGATPPGQPGQNPPVPPPGQTPPTGASGSIDSSAKKPTGVDLIYWRML
jgi:general secretion pathway protein K